MDLPIKFPDEADVIAEEAARFRALPDAERVKELEEAFQTYHFLIEASGRADELKRFAEEEEEQGRAAIREFVARYLSRFSPGDNPVAESPDSTTPA